LPGPGVAPPLAVSLPVGFYRPHSLSPFIITQP